MSTIPPYERPVNMMFQSYALFPHMSVEKNVAFGLEQEGAAARRSAARWARYSKSLEWPASEAASPTSSRAVSASASRWRARW